MHKFDLPVFVYDVLYRPSFWKWNIEQPLDKVIQEGTCTMVSYSHKKGWKFRFTNNDGSSADYSMTEDLGKKIFLTREEAEQAYIKYREKMLENS